MIEFINKNDKHVVIFGDFMIDKYVYGETTRISPEAPVPIVLVKKIEYVPGGAGNVCKQVLELDTPAILISRIGRNDVNTVDIMFDKCRKFYSCTETFIKDGYTIIKERIMSQGRQMLRIDHEIIEEPDEEDTIELEEIINKHVDKNCGAVVISDYMKGMCTDRLVGHIINRCQDLDIPVIVDTKDPNINKYQGATYITPNIGEYQNILKRYDEGYMLEHFFDHIIITLGDEGIRFLSGGRWSGIKTIPSVARNVFDVTGAGDVFVATLATALAIGKSPVEAAIIANTAAGLSVEEIGTTSVTLERLQDRLKANNLKEESEDA